jgi:hypothetical protein
MAHNALKAWRIFVILQRRPYPFYGFTTWNSGGEDGPMAAKRNDHPKWRAFIRRRHNESGRRVMARHHHLQMTL